MAHLIKLNQLDLNHDNTRTYIPILFNLDMSTSMEPSVSGKHTVINTSHNGTGIRVKETLDEILKLSNGCCVDKKQLNG
jgi:hypothetical protein